MSLSVTNEQASLPVAYRLYLPEVWAEDPLRWARAGVPDGVTLATKSQIALDQLWSARESGIAWGVVWADAGCGNDTAFRIGLEAMDLDYVVGVQSSASLWPLEQGPLPPKPWSGKGRPIFALSERLRAQTDVRQGSRRDLARRSLVDRFVARGHQYDAHLAVRCGSSSVG